MAFELDFPFTTNFSLRLMPALIDAPLEEETEFDEGESPDCEDLEVALPWPAGEADDEGAEHEAFCSLSSVRA